ncbi:class E sortase [Streptomyces sp. W16]|uniref:class E sortase n=1 Tax=Streptomyces sp. W16 TaxID=3076631 RepID=UPI00295B992C|nr:class E sortase [Streptomyces sp. W16]MDV9176874.1 class E sortase [Streptomyces sp. W16]
MRVPVVQQHSRRRRALRRRALWTGGELLVTAGVVLLLLVVQQLWWTNREARRGAEHQVQALERQWSTQAPTATPDAASGGTPSANTGADGGSSPSRTTTATGSGGSSTPHSSQAYAVLTIPRLHLRVPIAEGVSKRNVLNKGYVGHYPGTQQPGQAGNFALAGHRNTHGEPFRYLPRLRLKDTVQVETSAAVFTYTVDKILPQTSAADSGVIRPIPRSTVKPAYGYSAPGYYVTLTTCTPEFTSRYRMVVWGTLTSTRPRT